MKRYGMVIGLKPEAEQKYKQHHAAVCGEPHSVLQAINRQVAHYAYHVGQIVFLAKHLKGAEWKTLSVPKGQSDQYNAKMLQKQKTG